MTRANRTTVHAIAAAAIAGLAALAGLLSGADHPAAADPFTEAPKPPPKPARPENAPENARESAKENAPGNAPENAPAIVNTPGGAAEGAAEGGGTPTPAKQRYIVAAIGDSLTDARSHGGKFLDYLRERCPESQFDNYGKGGQMVNQMRKRFASDVLGDPPVPGAPKPAYTHVIVFGGVNDLYSDLTAGRTPKKVSQDLLLMYQGAKSRGMRVVAMTVAPWGGFKAYYNASRGAATLELNRWIRAQPAAGTVDSVIDTYPLLSCGDPERLCPELTTPFKDGLHFNGEAHKKLGKALHDQVFSSCL